MKTTIQLEWKDYWHALQLHNRPSMWENILGGISIILFLYLTIIGLYPPLYAIIFIVLFVAARQIFRPAITKSTFSQHPEVQESMDMQIDDQGVTISNPRINSKSTWDEIIQWKENKDAVLLYISKDLYYSIPKRFADEAFLTAIQTQVDAHQIPEHTPWQLQGRAIFVLVYIVFIGVFLWAMRG